MALHKDRSAEIHRQGGVFTKGRLIGHSDVRGRIREADSLFRRGRELGFIDEKHRIRRQRGFFRRSEVLGRIRGNAVYSNESLITGGIKLGWIDKNGFIWQSSCQTYSERIIGKAKGADPEAALAYFVLKFQQLDDHVQMLAEKVRLSNQKYSFLPRVRAVQNMLSDFDALGDFDFIVQRLDLLAEICADDLGKLLPSENERIHKNIEQHVTPETTLALLKSEWGFDALPSLEQAEALVGRVKNAFRLSSQLPRIAQSSSESELHDTHIDEDYQKSTYKIEQNTKDTVNTTSYGSKAFVEEFFETESANQMFQVVDRGITSIRKFIKKQKPMINWIERQTFGAKKKSN